MLCRGAPSEARCARKTTRHRSHRPSNAKPSMPGYGRRLAGLRNQPASIPLPSIERKNRRSRGQGRFSSLNSQWSHCIASARITPLLIGLPARFILRSRCSPPALKRSAVRPQFLPGTKIQPSIGTTFRIRVRQMLQCFRLPAHHQPTTVLRLPMRPNANNSQFTIVVPSLSLMDSFVHWAAGSLHPAYPAARAQAAGARLRPTPTPDGIRSMQDSCRPSARPQNRPASIPPSIERKNRRCGGAASGKFPRLSCQDGTQVL